MIAFGVYTYYDIRINREQIVANHRDKTELLTEIVSNGLMTLMCDGNEMEFRKFLGALVTEDVTAVRIFSTNGSIISSSVPGEVGKSVPRKEIDYYLNTGDSSNYKKKSQGSQTYSKMFVINNGSLCQTCHGAKDTIRGILNVEISAFEEDRLISEASRRIIRSSMITLTGLCLLMALTGMYFVRRPLAELVESIKRSGGKHPIDSALSGRSDEVGLISSRLNEIISDMNAAKAEIEKCNTDNREHIEKMASIGELAAAVAHEIKNPLAGISGALQVLAEDFPEASPRKEIASEILSEIDRLDRSVKELIKYARPPQLNPLTTDINAILENIRDSLKAPASALHVDIRLITEVVPPVMVDPEQMEQALLTIAGHSLQFMGKGGILTIKSRDRQETGEIELTFASTGDGMPEEDVTEIFKPMFSNRHAGGGLGLAISRNIIEGHHGRIRVESQAGAGTMFRIFLKKE